MVRALCVVLALSSGGCSPLKLTVLTGPGCCESAGESIAPVGPLEARAVVRASLAVAPMPIPPPPPPPDLRPGERVEVIAVVPAHADVRVACAIDERTAQERVTSETVEYGTVERVVLVAYAVAAAALGAVALHGAIANDDEGAGERAALGALGGALLADAAVTTGLALLHPTERHTATWDRPGAWSAQSDGCPSDLALAVDGQLIPVGVDGVVSDLDALRVADAARTGAPIDVVTRDARAPLVFALRAHDAGTVGEARAELVSAARLGRAR